MVTDSTAPEKEGGGREAKELAKAVHAADKRAPRGPPPPDKNEAARPGMAARHPVDTTLSARGARNFWTAIWRRALPGVQVARRMKKRTAGRWERTSAHRGPVFSGRKSAARGWLAIACAADASGRRSAAAGGKQWGERQLFPKIERDNLTGASFLCCRARCVSPVDRLASHGMRYAPCTPFHNS